MSDLLAHLPPDEPLARGHYGNGDGVTLATAEPALATLIAGRDEAALSAAFEAALGRALPQGPKTVSAAGLTIIGTGPGRWTVAAEDLTGEALAARLIDLAGGLGAVTDQSDASVTFDLGGAKVREALEKMVLIDINPAVFKIGDAATTPAALIGTTLWRTGETSYRCLIARSYALAFVRAVAVSAAAFGFTYA